MRMDLGTRNTLLYDFMHGMTAVSLEMSDEPIFISSKSVWVRIERMVGFAEVSIQGIVAEGRNRASEHRRSLQQGVFSCPA